MKKFKDYFGPEFQSTIIAPTVTVKSGSTTLSLLIDRKDKIAKASYQGPASPWFGSLCEIVLDKSVSELSRLSKNDWDKNFKEDQFYWDLKAETSDDFFFAPVELLKVGIKTFLGQEHQFKESDALVCRCFGVREKDVLAYMREAEHPTVDDIGLKLKAGMGCRSCLPQLKRWMEAQEGTQKAHYYKEKSIATWLVEIDYMLSCFPEASEWKMEVASMKNQQVIINFEKDVSQKVEEDVAKKLQDFLSASVDAGLAFFLRRSLSRQR